VAEVEVGLRAVLGDEHLAVLVRRHRARVDVDVRVELLDADAEPARDQEAPIEAAAMPLPSDDTTPPVTKMKRVWRSVMKASLSERRWSRTRSTLDRPADAADGRPRKLRASCAGGRVG
jgi:hypothetical protein